MVIQPGKEVNLNFTFTSSPNAVVEWSVDGSVVTTTGTDNFTASIVFTPMEAEGGNVTATVMMCDNSTTTETNLVVVGEHAQLYIARWYMVVTSTTSPTPKSQSGILDWSALPQVPTRDILHLHLR